MSRQLLVHGDKTFKITVPDDCKITFGPWSPPNRDGGTHGWREESKRGTLRVYEGTNVIAVFAGVSGYRDLALPYAEEVAKEEGATIWRDDERGYVREHKVSRTHEWIDPGVPRLPRPPSTPRKRRAAVQPG